ncbi:20655_t:CDS:2 [Rhizophagus irregularis]|nr:20655_t:CDS:2 [Rhizophagus irregularis]
MSTTATTEDGEYKRIIQIIKVINCDTENVQDLNDLDTNYGRISEIKVKDWIKKFFTQVKGRYDVGGWANWAKLLGALDKKSASGKVNFRSQQNEYIVQLEIILDVVQMTVDVFEQLYNMKNESNVQFHDKAKNLAEARNRFESMKFSGEMEKYEEPLRKLFRALKIWYRC